uniref:Uncharacterized protein n=1 Tax=Anguilla anguilla TaxID=7936 RepID=A0A0E9WYD2_ANGAN
MHAFLKNIHFCQTQEEYQCIHVSISVCKVHTIQGNTMNINKLQFHTVCQNYYCLSPIQLLNTENFRHQNQLRPPPKED